MVGSCTVDVHVMLAVPFPAVTDIRVADTEPVSTEDLGGLVPTSQCWNCEKSSARRQFQSAFLVTRPLPFAFAKGSGRYAIQGRSSKAAC